MARIAFIDADGTPFAAVWRCHQEGHDVLYWNCSELPEARKIGRGLVSLASGLPALRKFAPDVVVTYKAFEQAEAARAAGLVVWGCSPFARDLEDDRIAAADHAQRWGVGLVPFTNRFESPRDATRFLRADERARWVAKAEGDEDTSTTKVFDDKTALLDFLADREPADSIVLQEVIDGIEISFEAWYDWRHGFLRPFNSTLERKRFLAGDVGPMTGAAGSVMWAWPTESPKLFEQTLARFEPFLHAHRYHGPLDVNTIIDYDTRTPHFLEFTPRLGWDAFCAHMAGMPNVGDFLVGFGQGSLHRVPTPPGYMVAVRTMLRTAADVPLLAPWRESRELQLQYVYFDGKRLRTTGLESDNGFTGVFEAVAHEQSLEVALARAYAAISRIRVPDLAYRTDMGEHARIDIATLAAWGYEIPTTPSFVEHALSIPMGPTPIVSVTDRSFE